MTPKADGVTPAASTSVGGIGGDTSRLGNQANLKKAGEKLEATFTGLMLKEMRKAKLADPLFDSKALDTFTEMGDAKVAQSMAEHQPLGIGAAVTKFLGQSKAGAGLVQDTINPRGATPTA